MRRREVIVGSGIVATVALSGSAGAATNQTDDGQAMSSADGDLETVLELLPADAALDANYLRVQYSHVDGRDAENVDYQTRQVLEEVAEIDGEIDTEAVSDVVSVNTENGDLRLSAATGSFDRPSTDAADTEERGDWRIGELSDDKAFAAADDRLIGVSATETDPTDIAGTAVDAATGETETVLVSPDATESVFKRLESAAYVVFFPDLEAIDYLEFDDRVESFGAGFEESPVERSGTETVESEYVLELASDADVDDDWILEQLERIEQGEFVETTIERDGTFAHVEAVIDLPPERDRDAAPDARVRAKSSADEGQVTFEHNGGEAIDAANLEGWIDGELADRQLADEYDTFTEGDTFDLETGPVANVGLRWFDEAEDVYYYYDTTLVGSESFEASHDPETDTVEITYTGELEADPGRLEIVHRQRDGGQDRNNGTTRTDRTTLEDLESVSGSLVQGETITVEDVTLGDRVSLEPTTPANPNRGQRSLAQIRVRPPRIYLSRHEETLVARYVGDREHDADEFRVLIGDDPAETQFADVTETLSTDTELELGEVSHGTTVTVEWLEPDPDDPVVIEDHVLRPHGHVDFTYDDAEGTVVGEYREGEEIAADALELRVNDEPATTQPADEYETFSPGDDVRVAGAPFKTVELVWEGPDDTESGLGRITVGRDALEAVYEPETEAVELVYTGTQPADPSALSVDHGGDGPRSGDGEPLFAQQYDTLTEGDSVVIEDVAIDDRITVMLVQEGDGYVSHRSLFHFTPEPRWAFRLEERDQGLVAIYREETNRDADGFRFLVDDEPADVQPADEYETLTDGDEIELREYQAGTEITVEWTVPDEPREVTNHVVAPDAEFDVEYDSDNGSVTVEHTGGDEIAADDLGVVVEPTMHEPQGWDDYETVSKGDATTVDLDEASERDRDPVGVVIVYKGSDAISHKRLDE